MTDDLKVRLPQAFTVRGAGGKRDHQADGALTPVPQQQRDDHRRHGNRGDSAEFSVDGEDDPPPAIEASAQPDPPPESAPPDRPDDDAPPGSILNIEA